MGIIIPEISIGSRVRVKSFEQLCREFPKKATQNSVEIYLSDGTDLISFSQWMIPLCGKEACVSYIGSSVYDGFCVVEATGWIDCENLDTDWHFYNVMFEEIVLLKEEETWL